MGGFDERKDDISGYIHNHEFVANNYVLRCFTVTMMVYAVTVILNLLDVFVVEQSLMWKAFVPSLCIYLFIMILTKHKLHSSRMAKYVILFCTVAVFTISGVFLTYHVVIISLLPFLYAMLYSSKRVMRYVYVLTVISTFIVVYGGYFYGLSDANMVLLTTEQTSKYIINGEYVLTMVNQNPQISLLLFYVVPRCLIYIAFVFVCNSIVSIVNGSLERAKLTDALKKAKEEAEQANRSKSEFLARVSHEIRTPVNAVMGMDEMIMRESTEEHIKDYAKDIRTSSELLLNIINELLDLAKIDSGRMELEEGNYEIGSLLNDLYNMVNIRAREKGLVLHFKIDSVMPNELYGDEKKVRQVLLNLLTNAVKYTEQGTVVLHVSCRLQEEYACLRFVVEDTGIGIRQEDIGKIYDAFQRFDMDRNRHVEGTGLGMNIAQQFLKLMGSKLQIESEYGKGSRFSFEVVQKIVSDKPLGDLQKRLTDANAEPVRRTRFVASKANILVVDDNKMNRKVFKGLLKSSQMTIAEAQSGEECLEILRKEKFDLVFLDHMMPGLNGIETLHVIREEGLCQNNPIVMLTANAILGDREKYLGEGFDDFLSKPIMPDKLDKLILRLLPQELIETEQIEAEERKEAEMEVCFDINCGLQTCGGDMDFYRELLKDYTELGIKEELTGYLEAQDIRNYCIRIHGFKNNSYSIGANSIGDLAYKMEQISKTEFSEEIETLQRELFAQYDEVCGLIVSGQIPGDNV